MQTYSQLNLGRITPPGGIPTSTSDVFNVIITVFQFLFALAGVVTVGIIIYSGIKMIVSSGDPQKMKDAQSSLVNAVIGLVVTLAAVVLVNFIATKLGVNSVLDLRIPYR